MKKTLSILILSVFILSGCEKEENLSKIVSGSYQGREIILFGQSFALPSSQLGMQFDCFIQEMSENGVNVTLESTLDGVRDSETFNAFAKRDGSRILIQDNFTGYNLEYDNGTLTIEETFEGQFVKITFRKL